MKQEKIIGTLLIAGAIGVFIPYTILTITFNYPDILMQDSSKKEGNHLTWLITVTQLFRWCRDFWILAVKDSFINHYSRGHFIKRL